MERDEYTDRYVNPYTDFGFKKLFRHRDEQGAAHQLYQQFAER